MAKKKKNNVGLYLTLATVLLSVLGLCLFLFLNSAQLYVGEKTSEDLLFTGLQVTFGYTGKLDYGMIHLSAQILKFSFFNFLPLLLVVVGVVLTLISKNNKVLGLVGGGTLILAAVFFVFSSSLLVVSEDLKQAIDVASKLVKISFKQAIGAYLGATCAGLAGVAAILKTAF